MNGTAITFDCFGELTLTPGNDTGCEGDEYVAIMLKGGESSYHYGDGQALLTLIDGGVTAGTYDYSDLGSLTDWTGSEASGQATFTASMNNTCPFAVPVTYYTEADSAKDSGTYPDYASAAGTLSFPPGESEQAISVFINDDEVYEGAETFNLHAHVNFTGASIQTATGTILDSGAGADPPPTVSISGGGTVDEGDGTIGFTVTLSKPLLNVPFYEPRRVLTDGPDAVTRLATLGVSYFSQFHCSRRPA